MTIPDEFKHRIFRTRFTSPLTNAKYFQEMLSLAPGSDLDVVYESVAGHPVPMIVIVFETQEDCLAFTLAHGHKYA